MHGWKRAGQLRRYCDALETRCADLPLEQQAAATAWLEWARQQADLLDPLRKELSELTSLTVELPEWFTEDSYNRPNPDWWTKTDSE